MGVRSRVVVLSAAGLVLAACGQVHPGSAAVVDGKSISMSDVESTSKAVCASTLANAQGQTQSIDNADVRRSAVARLIVQQAANDLAKSKAITIPAQVVAPTTISQLKKAYGSQAGVVLVAYKADQRYNAILTILGRQSLGSKAQGATADTLSQAGEQVLIAHLRKADIDIDPRFGLSSIFATKTTTGSLAVTVTPKAKIATTSLSRCEA